jgi:hypothetical protein
MSFFPSRHRCCPQCCQRKVKVNGKKVIEYYHRGVIFHLVGFPIAMPLDVEMIRPREGEVKAAQRLLERAIDRYGRFFDVALVDAIYLVAPFFNREFGKNKTLTSAPGMRKGLPRLKGLGFPCAFSTRRKR